MNTSLASASGAALPRSRVTPTTIAELEISRHESFRIEVRMARNGGPVFAISRWKLSPWPHRTGPALEFGAHRAGEIVALLESAIERQYGGKSR
jgi:hypothetical protein